MVTNHTAFIEGQSLVVTIALPVKINYYEIFTLAQMDASMKTFKSNIQAQKWTQIGSNIQRLKMYHWEFCYILGSCNNWSVGAMDWTSWTDIRLTTSGGNGWLMKWARIYLSDGRVWCFTNVDKAWLQSFGQPKSWSLTVTASYLYKN